MKSLTNFEILPVTLFRKMVSKAVYDMHSGENRPMVAKKSQNSPKRLSEQSSELVSVFKVTSRNFITIFLFHIYRKSYIIPKKYSSGDPVS